jgi:FHA domain
MADSKPVALPPHLWEALEEMSHDMGVDIDGLVSQAVFTLARLNGYVLPGRVGESASSSSSPSRPPFASKPSATGKAGKGRHVEPEPEPEPEDNPFDHPASGEEPVASGQEPEHEPVVEAEPEPAPPPRGKAGLTLFVAGRDPYRMTGESFTIGRGKTCDFVIESNRVSREHCRIAKEASDYVLEDLNSSNGTFFGPNKEKVTRRKIKDGDEFTLGTEKIRFQIRK